MTINFGTQLWNISCISHQKTIYWQYIFMKAGDYVVELDQFKTTLNTFKDPLQEVRDSL